MEESSAQVVPPDGQPSAAGISSLHLFGGAFFGGVFIAGIALLGRGIEEVTSTLAQHGDGRPASHVCALMLFGAVITSVGASALLDLTGIGRRQDA